jgi:TM2 domain-containing membrane protein YozV
MNCANHTDVSAVAFCRTCGKPLCAQCTREVRGVIYCENCLAARMESVQPPAMPAAPVYAQPAMPQQGGPNPAVAGILAGFFPFGVGAVYTSQYAKGLAHLIISVLLIIGMSHGEALSTFCGLAFAFFYIYQIVDAVRSAHAISAGVPPPDPFGLAQAFGAGEKIDASKIPTGAIVLIGLGGLFLLHTMGVFDLNFGRIWPIFLIALGVWLFARSWGLVSSSGHCYCERCRTRGLMWPAVLVTVGFLSLLEDFTRFGWDRTWPLLILIIGIVMLLRSNASPKGHNPPPTDSGQSVPPPLTNTAETPQPPANEVRNV